MTTTLTTKRPALLLALAVASAAAWTSPISHLSSPVSHRSRSVLTATNQRDGEEPSSLDRRDFFSSAAAKAVSLSLLASFAAFEPASAATDAAPYSNVYKPAPHSMDGKLVVITGGNTGLGLESTKRLAEAGASVVFTSRDEAKGRKALAEVNDYLTERTAGDSTFAGKARVASLDLCDLSDVKSFSDRLTSIIGKDAKIDVLMNNAGVMAIPDRIITKDGYEKTFQTNHLGHFALTSTLLPLLSPNARVVNVSSVGYQFASKNGLELDNLNGEREYGPWSSYGLSKLENILFVNELQRRASNSERWRGLTAYSLHPGAVQTDLARYLIGEEKFKDMKENGFSSWKDKVLMEGLAKFVKTVEEGASTQVYLAAAPGLGPSEAGRFFSDGKVTGVKGFATDEGKGRSLWDVSEKLSGVKLDL
eukprot:CAMPEP_0172535724 /NCGR_PEP_ID=MMETSP1067-20121228/7597_1 /TAXON_ID=265564 ORGANISM="Thalassiosira punctigera, Strain Tpunct2005C2" /NCGR_SAMPLE_ID=MMETSP1067 /ASSEMBLY_ACC=CAM_ASM_000444 /LENGTH=420 /DNA_ID=CAMNT_0013320665 /DNA_START=117 /DNA_END=1379 /DNA_ORIENTATION=-